ncbi:MAG: transposase [Candidatus Aminicenantes bacterium]|nr:transposase [Candidatus Aminicenantes bacterium]
MSWPLRIEYENAFYHVIARGERRDAIFTCPADKEKFLIKLGETTEKYRLLVHVYVLMDTHYHMLVEMPQGNLSHGPPGSGLQVPEIKGNGRPQFACAAGCAGFSGQRRGSPPSGRIGRAAPDAA